MALEGIGVGVVDVFVGWVARAGHLERFGHAGGATGPLMDGLTSRLSRIEPQANEGLTEIPIASTNGRMIGRRRAGPNHAVAFCRAS
jgi:hypothetical protein